jgi:hypothetical protein
MRQAAAASATSAGGALRPARTPPSIGIRRTGDPGRARAGVEEDRPGDTFVAALSPEDAETLAAGLRAARDAAHNDGGRLVGGLRT